METHLELVQAGFRGEGLTIKVAPGSDCNGKDGSLQVQTT